MEDGPEETNQNQSADINEKLLLDLAWERQQKKVRAGINCFDGLGSLILYCDTLTFRLTVLMSFECNNNYYNTVICWL